MFAELRAHLAAQRNGAKLFAHVDKNGLKRGMISILHGGDYRNAIFCHPADTALPKGKWRRTLNPTTLPFCDAFTKEVKGIATALVRLPDHTGDWALAHTKAAKKQGHDGTGCRAHGNAHGIFVSLICQRVERRVTDCMLKAFEARGRTVSVLVFDGQMVLLQRDEDTIAPVLLRVQWQLTLDERGARVCSLAERASFRQSVTNFRDSSYHARTKCQFLLASRSQPRP